MGIEDVGDLAVKFNYGDGGQGCIGDIVELVIQFFDKIAQRGGFAHAGGSGEDDQAALVLHEIEAGSGLGKTFGDEQFVAWPVLSVDALVQLVKGAVHH